MDYSVVIPTYNGGPVLSDLIDRLIKILSEKYLFEIIIVFDSGKVKTKKTVKEIKEKHPDEVHVYYLTRNYGQHRATEFGFSRALGKFIITMDDDLQHNPEDLRYLISKQKEGDYDVVYGRFTELKHNRIRSLISRLLRKFLLQHLPHLYKDYSPYRLIKSAIAKNTTLIAGPYVFVDEYLGRVSTNISSVEVEHNPRISGESSYTFPKLLNHGILILTEYAKIDSKLIIPGLVLALSGLLLICWHIGVPTTSPIGPSALALSGLLLSFIGLIVNCIKWRNRRRNSEIIKFSE